MSIQKWFCAAVIAAIFAAPVLLLGTMDVSAQSKRKASKVIKGKYVIWHKYNDNWRLIPTPNLPVDVDECIGNERKLTVICIKLYKKEDVGNPTNAIDKLLDSLKLSDEQKPQVRIDGDRAYFDFSARPKFMPGSMNGKVHSAYVSRKQKRIRVFMGAWATAMTNFSSKDFDIIMRRSRLK